MHYSDKQGLCVLKCSSYEAFSFPFVVQMSLIARETRECCPTGFPAGADLPKLTIALSPKTIRILKGGKLSALIFIDPSLLIHSVVPRMLLYFPTSYWSYNFLSGLFRFFFSFFISALYFL